MQFSRFLAYLIGFLAPVAALLCYLEYVHMLGFPDGHITELGYAQRRLAYLFIAISIPAGLFAIYLGSIAKRQRIEKALYLLIILYLLAIISLSLINHFYRTHLAGGGG